MIRSRRLAVGLAAALVFAACGGSDDNATTTSATAETSSTVTKTSTPSSTTTEPSPTFPLTGLPVTDPIVVLRRALVAKIDNHPIARPQSGLNAADIVFEENVEGLTRFAAVFHSQDPLLVGPVRSGRTQDIALLSSLNNPLLVWSGGNAAVTAAINASTLVNRGPSAAPGYSRSDRPGPHDLYADTTAIWATSPEELSPPPAQFDIRTGDDAISVGGATVESAGVKVSMNGVRVAWAWDPETRRFARSQNDAPHLDADGVPIRADNVVILFVDYRPSPADRNSPEAQTVGNGEVWVYTEGTLTLGTWERRDIMSPWTLTDADGDPIVLASGQTWVQLAEVGSAAIVAPDTDLGSVPYP
jgi:hypothetical protein